MFDLTQHKTTIKTALLNEGTKVLYDICLDKNHIGGTEIEKGYTSGGLKYLGEGVIYSINGINQDSERQCKFWRKPASKP